MSGTIWVLVELEEGKAARSSLEVLGKAAQLGRAEAVVLGSADAAYDNYLTLPAVDTLSALLKQHQPTVLMMATTYDLRDIAARLNVRNNMGLITDATDLRFEGDMLQVTVPWGGDNIVTATFPQQGTAIVLTRPKAFAVTRTEGKTAEVENIQASLNTNSQTIKILDRVEVPTEGPALEEASVIVSG